jgi:hypothetical protein
MKNNYRLSVIAILLFAFLFGWGFLALFYGFVWGEADLALKAPLFGILPFFYIGSVGFWISLVITLGLLISIVMSLIKLQWKKVMYLAVILIVAYWIWCAIVIWLSSKI